jgi:hypothetical protein
MRSCTSAYSISAPQTPTPLSLTTFLFPLIFLTSFNVISPSKTYIFLGSGPFIQTPSKSLPIFLSTVISNQNTQQFQLLTSQSGIPNAPVHVFWSGALVSAVDSGAVDSFQFHIEGEVQIANPPNVSLIVGLAVGVPVSLIFLASLVVGFVFWRRKSQTSKSQSHSLELENEDLLKDISIGKEIGTGHFSNTFCSL